MQKTLRLFIILLFTFCFYSGFTTNYTFTGNGEWTDANNWAGGITPWAGSPGGLTATDSITITGTTGLGVNCTSNCPYGTLGGNSGTIIIAAGGTFTIQNFTQFSNQGKIIVNGTLITKTQLEMFPEVRS